MTDSLTVIFCGQVRDRDLLFRSIDNLWRQGSGLYIVEQIIFATWKSELANYRGLSAELLAKGVDLIEMDDPFYIPMGLGNIDRQMIALHWGLTLCAPGNHVFRTRSDLAFNAHPDIGWLFEDYFEAVRSSRASEPEDFRIWVGSCSIMTPFFMQDRFFMGSVASMKKMPNFRNDILCIGNAACNVPEIRWYAGALFDRYPFIPRILSIDWLCAERYRPELFDAIAQLPFTQAALVNYLKIIDRHFWVGSSRFNLENMREADLPTTIAEIPLSKAVFDSTRANIMERAALTEEMVAPDAPFRPISENMIAQVDDMLRRFASGVRPGIPRVTHAKTTHTVETVNSAATAPIQVRLLYGAPLHAGQVGYFEFRMLDEREHDGAFQPQSITLVYRWIFAGKEAKRSSLTIDMNNAVFTAYPQLELPDVAGSYLLKAHVENAAGATVGGPLSLRVQINN